MKTLTVQVPEELIAKLKARAKMTNMKQSDIVRFTLDNGLSVDLPPGSLAYGLSQVPAHSPRKTGKR